MSNKINLSSIKNEQELQELFALINDKELVNLSSAYKPVDYLSHLDWFNATRKAKDLVFFAIKTGDILVGSCQLHSISSVHKKAELQIRLSPKHQGKGYGLQALQKLIDYGFLDLGLHKIYLHVFATNKRAIALYAKLGFTSDGILKDDVFINGKFVDVHVMSLIK